jgi:YhcH/YjgK/YiaL family protein
MFGTIELLIAQVNPASRLHEGLLLLRDFREGRRPEISLIFSRQSAGDVARIAVHDDSLYMLIQTYKARDLKQARFEAHQYHTDLQYVCAGQEWVRFCDLRTKINPPAYDQNNNIYFPLDSGDHSRLLLNNGNVGVFFPDDAHAPCLRVEGREDEWIRKIVVKVKDIHLLKIASTERVSSRDTGGRMNSRESAAC